MDAESAVEHLLDLEVRRDLERALANVLGFDEALDSKHAETSAPVMQIGDA